jgi:peptide/nickel transport system substrate-binding protein
MNRRCSRFLAAGISLAAILLAAGCTPSATEPPTLHYGLTLAPTGIDPHLNASSELGIPLASVYDTLVFLDPETGQFVPGLAERWEISPDGLAYTFHLRGDVVFHDGTPFNADAVRANLAYTLNPDNHSQKAASMLGPLESVEVLDEHTVVLHLSDPFAPLLDSLSQVYLGMASPAALDQWGPAEYSFHQVGTGPYRFVEYIPNDHLTLERNPDYAWGPSLYRAQQATIERIVFTFYESEPTRALALQGGEVDVVGEVPPRDAARLAASGDFTLTPVAIPGQPLEYFFNTRQPPTDDLRVRQALIFAVDRDSIVQTVFGTYSPVAQGLLSTVTPGYASGPEFAAFDLDEARRLLREAGWEDHDGDGKLDREGQPFSLALVAPNWGSNPEVAQLLQAAWEDLGAEVSLQVAAGFGPLREIQAAGAYNAIGLNFFGTDPDQLRAFYASDGLYNWSGADDPEIDSLLDEASRLPLDPTLRTERYRQLAARVRENALVLPIRDYVDLVVSSNRVQGLRFSAQGWFPILIELRLES